MCLFHYTPGFQLAIIFFQKGTGKWTAISALEYGIPLTLIGRIIIMPGQCDQYRNIPNKGAV